jgi:hypothetical protein
MENPNIPDCTSCKLVGAGGCFAGAAYALYERSRLPPGGKNRVWLSVIGVGKSCNFFVNFNIDTSKNMYAKQLSTSILKWHAPTTWAGATVHIICRNTKYFQFFLSAE